MLKKTSATLGAFLTAFLWGASTTFGVVDETTYSPSLPDVPLEATAKIDPKTTVFLYLGEAADEKLRRIYAEYNRTIAEALVAAERDAYERYLAEEEAKWKEIEKAATLEHDAVFRQIEAESKTPEEKQKRIVRFYEYLGVHAPGKPSNPGMTLEEARKRAIKNETQKVYAKVYKVAIMDPQPWKRARRRVAAESWRRVEREFWPSVAEKIDWENLCLDGARFDFRPEVAGAYDSENNDAYAKFGGFFGEIDGLPFRWGIPATLEQLRQTKSWREKTLRGAEFYRVFTDASFVGWTFEDCRFEANRYGEGFARFELFDGKGKPEMRAPGDLWQSSGKESKSDKIVGYDACDFTDATLRNVYFDRTATITFEQFAATRSFKEDEIIAEFGFTLAGWDFSGKNVGDLLFETGMYEPELSAIRRKGGKTGWASLKLDGARFEPRGDRTYSRRLPDELWRSSRRFREKDLSGATFDVELNGGDFSGFDLTGATMRGVRVNLDGATIRGLRVVVDGNGNSERERIEFKRRNAYGKITKETICATKSWQDKDLRDVEFNWFYDLTGVDFSGCDLRGATFRFAKGYGAELEKAPFFEDVDFTDAKIDGARFEVFAKEGERSWPTLEQIMSTETWKSGDLERLKTCVLPDEAQKIVDRRLFEASPEFAAKDFSGKEIKFRDMSDWDLSGLNLTGCKIKTRSLYRANFTDAILDGATLEQSDFGLGPITTERLLDQPFLSVKTFIETDNYRRKNFRGFRVSGDVLFWRDFSFVGLDLTNATFYSWFGGFDEKALAKFDFTDAEIEGFSLIPWLTKKQLLSTKTFKEGRLDYESVDKIRLGKERIGDELRAEYERLQAGKKESVENAAETAETEAFKK